MKNNSPFRIIIQRSGAVIFYAIVFIVLVILLYYLRGMQLEPAAMVVLIVLSLFSSFAGVWLTEAERQVKLTHKETSLKRKIFVLWGWATYLFAFAISIIIVAQIAIGISRYMGWF